MPITESVYQVLFEDLDVLRALSQLMSREMKAEK
jgi:glycerol-3-phosphate dehydrogenase